MSPLRSGSRSSRLCLYSRAALGIRLRDMADDNTVELAPEELEELDEEVEEVDDDLEDDFDEIEDDVEDESDDDEYEDDEESSEESSSDDHDDETVEALEELETQELQLLDEEASETLLVDEVTELRAMRREELTMNVDAQGQKSDEFVCQSCFMVKRTSQLANKRKMICQDCVA